MDSSFPSSCWCTPENCAQIGKIPASKQHQLLVLSFQELATKVSRKSADVKQKHRATSGDDEISLPLTCGLIM